MNDLVTKSSLTDAHRRLLELMQRLNFGRIEDLIIRGGEPVFDPAPRSIQKVKIGGENGPRPEVEHDDFRLKRQTLDVLDAIRRLGDGKVLAIEVKHGLPFSLEIELADCPTGPPLDPAVDSVTLDQALALVREVAQRKARAFARRWRFTYDEGEDVESDLVLAFIYRWPKFDPARASIQTFASRLMDKELISIVRYRLAQRRQAREFPTGAGRTMGAPIHQFRIDLERALAPLPTVVRQTAAALSCLSAVDAASAARCSRQTINNRKRQIGKALLAGGISPTYFHGGGGAS